MYFAGQLTGPMAVSVGGGGQGGLNFTSSHAHPQDHCDQLLLLKTKVTENFRWPQPLSPPKNLQNLRPCCNGASRLSSRQNLGCHGWYKLHVIALSNLDVLLITAKMTGKIFISSRRASSLHINQALR